MTDEILQELWNTKDNIAKEHGYDIDDLAAYYLHKQTTRLQTLGQEKTNIKAEQKVQGDVG